MQTERLGQNRLSLRNSYVTGIGRPTTPWSGSTRRTRSRRSTNRLITPLTSRIPTIRPNTPNNRLACVFTAANPMNSIIAQYTSPVSEKSSDGLRRTGVVVGVADLGLNVADWEI